MPGEAPSKPNALDLAFNPRAPNDFTGRRVALKLVGALSGKVAEVVELGLNPENYQRTFQVRGRIHPTAGGFHYDRLRDARGLGHFVFSGTTGHYPHGAPAAGQNVTDGMAELRALQRIMDAVSSPTINGVAATEYKLILLDPFAPLSSKDAAGNGAYIVVPDGTGLDIHMSSDRRTTYGYTLRLAAIEPYESEPRKLDQKDRERSFLQQVQDAIYEIQRYSFDNMFSRYRRAIGPILRARAMIADVGQFMKNWATGLDGLLNFHVSLMESFVSALESVRDGFYALIPGLEPDGVDLPPGAAVATDERLDPATADRVQTVQLASAVRRVLNGALANPNVLGPRLAEPASIGGRSGAAGRPSPLALNNRRQRLRPRDQADRRPWLANNPSLASRLVQVGAGDTMERLIPSGFTDLDVTNLNPALRYPFVDGNRDRGDSLDLTIAFAGDFIRVPATTGGVQSTSRGASPGAGEALKPRETEAERIFGRDLLVQDQSFSRLLPDGTQVRDDAPGLVRRGGDFAKVGGDECLGQRLRHALCIRRGDLSYADIGLDFDGAHFSSAMQVQLAAAAVRNTVQADPGIQSVTLITARAEDGRMVVAVEAESISGTPVGPLATTI